jgi:hypothetical protein
VPTVTAAAAKPTAPRTPQSGCAVAYEPVWASRTASTGHRNGVKCETTSSRPQHRPGGRIVLNYARRGTE